MPLNRILTLKAYIEHHQDRDELGEAEGDAELEGGEGGDHGGPALPDQVGDAADVNVPGGERCCDRSLRHGE